MYHFQLKYFLKPTKTTFYINTKTTKSVFKRSNMTRSFPLPNFECDRRPHKSTVELKSDQGTTTIVEREDPYHWLRMRGDDNVMRYIEQENEYQTEIMKHTEPIQQALYEELLSRIKQDDSSVPVRRREYLYYSKNLEGKQYKVYCRRVVSEEAREADGIDFYQIDGTDQEQVLLDLNEIVDNEKLSFLQLGVYKVSPDGNWLCYGHLLVMTAPKLVAPRGWEPLGVPMAVGCLGVTLCVGCSVLRGDVPCRLQLPCGCSSRRALCV